MKLFFSSEIVSSPQDSKFHYDNNAAKHTGDATDVVGEENVNADDGEAATGGDFTSGDYSQKKNTEATSEDSHKENIEEIAEGDDDFNEEEAGDSVEASENLDSESKYLMPTMNGLQFNDRLFYRDRSSQQRSNTI